MKQFQGELTFEEAAAGLLPHQKQFMTCPALAAALVGGQGSGKSMALCMLAIAAACLIFLR